ncbi:MAG: family 78 glycoside hydrolase catalytic domain [Chloroflexota bacterium]
MRILLHIFLVITALFIVSPVAAQTRIEKLMVEYAPAPLGIDVKQPRFSWQMVAPDGKRGYFQSSFQIVVKDPSGTIVWDSKKISEGNSVGIKYAGSLLRPSTRYEWSVTAWDQKGKPSTASSWFETGLMNPGIEAWDGAEWIGGSSDDLVLFSQYLIIYSVQYRLTLEPGSTRASFIYGANDPRLMDKNKNIYQVEKKKNESYIKVELDISGVDGRDSGMAKINIYRSGYKDTDISGKPIRTFHILPQFINNDNKYSEHLIQFSSIFGQISLMLDGSASFIKVAPPASQATQQGPPEFGGRQTGASVNLNPVGNGGNYIPFGMLCDIGFSVDAGQKAAFSQIVVTNNRVPNNVLFREDLSVNKYQGIYSEYASDPSSGLKAENGKIRIDGGTKGLFIVADPGRNSSPMLRTVFQAQDKAIKSARLYVTARGIYEIFMNGERVGEDYYNPGLTQYNVTHLYQTYDVKDLLRKGENAVGAMLGEGWWSGLLSFGNIWNHFGDRQSLLAKIVITYDDGTSQVITTNGRDWKYYNNGPVVYSSLDMGEFYDATREKAVEGWTAAGYNDENWKEADIVPLDGTTFTGSSKDRDGTVTTFNFEKFSLTGQIGNNAGIYKVLTAKSVNEVRKGVFVYNMGQNIVGVPRIQFSKGTEGKKITLRFSEMLYPDLKESGANVGMLMTENYRAALSQDIYVMKDGSQTYQPRFTSHGFQYIEITGIESALPLESVQCVAISSVRELSADYSTSNEKVNKLWSNLVWSNIDNFLTIPTDCPQRNERMGWSGDINVFSRTASYVSNADQFFRRHMFAMRDVQLPAGKFTDVAPVGGGFGGVLWGSAGIVVPWETYLQYGDRGILEENYPAMLKYMDYLETTVDPKTGISSDGQLGDWLGPQNNQLGSGYLVAAYHAYDLGIMMKVAALLGNISDAQKFTSLYEKRKEFFNSKFVNSDKKALGLIGGGRGFGGQAATPPELKVADVQTAYAVGLAMDLFNEENKPFMIRNLAEAVKRQNKDDGGVLRPENSLMTGFIGTAWISKSLSDNGLTAHAYKLLQNNKYPSWIYPIEQGATTIWERLNGYTVENGFGGNNSMNSFNHYSFGAVGQWMIAYSLGIQREVPGFRRFILQPEPDPTGEMKWARGFYDSMYGKIFSSWKVENGVLTYEATVPANTTATLYLPASSFESVTENGKKPSKARGLTFIKYENGKAVYELNPGSYRFSSGL